MKCLIRSGRLNALFDWGGQRSRREHSFGRVLQRCYRRKEVELKGTRAARNFRKFNRVEPRPRCSAEVNSFGRQSSIFTGILLSSSKQNKLLVVTRWNLENEEKSRQLRLKQRLGVSALGSPRFLLLHIYRQRLQKLNHLFDDVTLSVTRTLTMYKVNAKNDTFSSNSIHRMTKTSTVFATEDTCFRDGLFIKFFITSLPRELVPMETREVTGFSSSDIYWTYSRDRSKDKP